MKQTRYLLLIFIIILNSYKIIASNTFDSINDTIIKNSICNGEFSINSNGLNIWYKISGSGPICIMPTPGWGISSDLYFNSFKDLEELFTMVYIDTRGSGRSDKPELGQYTLENFIYDIDEVRKNIGIDKVYLHNYFSSDCFVVFQYPARQE